jgi:uncharacterized protein YqfB (UPF0267 family)
MISGKIEKVEFQQNFNNKLLGQYFISIRATYSKFKIGNRLAVYLKDRFLCYADVISTEEMILEDVINKNLHLLDSGMNEIDFLEYMESIHGKKTWWKGRASKVNINFFKKVTQTDIFDPLP